MGTTSEMLVRHLYLHLLTRGSINGVYTRLKKLKFGIVRLKRVQLKLVRWLHFIAVIKFRKTFRFY